MMTLYGYYKSGCTWRVRLVLALKGFHYGEHIHYIPVNLLKKEQLKEEFAQVAVAQRVPVLLIRDPSVSEGEVKLTESVAICEFLEEVYPQTRRLIPADPIKRFQMRRLVEVINSGSQPLQNSGVLAEISTRFGEEHKTSWAQFWIRKGLATFESHLSESAGQYCIGDEVTLADIFLVSQLGNAQIQGVDIADYPMISAITERLYELPEFQ